MNLKIENVRRQLVDIINQSGLPIGVIYYMFKDLFGEISQEHNNAIRYEMRQLEEVKKSETETKEDENKKSEESS